MQPVIIGVAGGSGSGKTTVVQEIINDLGLDAVAFIQHDSYYHDRSHVPPDERVNINYDHPDALETTLLVEHLRELKSGCSIDVPVYDFNAHARTAATSTVKPRSVVILEGILILADRDLRDLMDILRRVPGLGISVSDTGLFPTVEVRGIKSTLSEKILFMMDGHRLNTSLNGSATAYYTDMPVESIKRVEVIRGPGSALYGASAFMAVINIVTKEADDINGVQFTLGSGSFQTSRGNILFGHKGEKFEVTGQIDHIDTNGPASLIEQDADGISGYTSEWKEKTDISLNLIYKDFTFRSRYIWKRMGANTGISYALNDESIQDYQSGYLDLSYKNDITEKLDLTVRLFMDRTVNDPLWEQHSEGYTSGGFTYTDGVVGNPRATGKTLGTEVTADYKLQSHLITTGIMFENERQYDTGRSINFDPVTFAPTTFQDVTATGNYTRDEARHLWAVYLQDIWDITKEASLTIGVRHDQYSDFGGTTNPRAGFVWEFIEGTSLKLLYGSAFRAPTFAELYYFSNPVWGGNPALKPEEIQTYEAGIEHRFLQKHTLKLNYFFNDIKDLIVFGTAPAGSSLRTYENSSNVEIQGIELELLSAFGNETYSYANYTYQDPKNSTTGARLPNVPLHRANAGVNFVPWKHLNTNINVSWTGKRSRAAGDTRNELPSKTLVDMTVIANKFHKNFELRGSLYNIFDEDYRDPTPYPVKIPNDYPANRRMFIVEARYTF